MVDFPNLIIINHPVLQHGLSTIRPITADISHFRAHVRRAGYLLAMEATRHLSITHKAIQTPLCAMNAPFLTYDFPVIIPILRAGLGLSDGVSDFLPHSSIGYVGVARNHITKEAEEYYTNFPNFKKGQKVLVADPMLATGNSAIYALKMIMDQGVAPDDIMLLTLLCAPEGVRNLYHAYPDVQIYTTSLDDHLNENAYIVPGLGDAGDRLFGT
jgi:uracil phosphoribosyltransferase